MRTVLLSLKPEVFNNVNSGEKIYEHRNVFPDGPVIAYVYISRPVQKIEGILYLDNKVNIDEWKKKYSFDADAVERIDKYLERYKVAMEIRSFQDTTGIALKKIKGKFPGFVIPQMYYYLDGLPLLDYLKDNLKPIGDAVTHNFDEVNSDLICIH